MVVQSSVVCFLSAFALFCVRGLFGFALPGVRAPIYAGTYDPSWWCFWGGFFFGESSSPPWTAGETAPGARLCPWLCCRHCATVSLSFVSACSAAPKTRRLDTPMLASRLHDPDFCMASACTRTEHLGLPIQLYCARCSACCLFILLLVWYLLAA